MNDSIESSQGEKGSPDRWLLLIHQIPPKPDYFRVRVRRQLQRLGAVALKSSVYVLPNSDETIEDFQWLRRSVVDDGGEATICVASFVEGVSDGELESMFRAQSDAEYDAILEATGPIRSAPTETDVQRLERQLGQARARDFFDAPRGPVALRAVHAIEADFRQDRNTTDSSTLPADPHPRAATWVTRAGVHVDRMASAWLIRRFVDPDGNFKFVPSKGYVPNAGELRFDMFEGEFTHQGDKCTFEVLHDRYLRHDSALRAIAEVVHDIDYKDEKFGRHETPGVATVIRGITFAHSDDASRVSAAEPLFDGLYASFQRSSS